MTPLERLQGIQDKFNKAVNPSAYMKAKPQVAPGAAATKIMLNKPGTAGISGAVKPTAAKGLAGKFLGPASKLLGPAAYLMHGFDEASALVQSLQRGEGFAAIPGLVNEGLSGLAPKVTPQVPSASDMMSGSRGPAKSVPGLPADYKATEQQAINDALIFKGQKNRNAQIEADVIPGTLPN